MPDGHAWGNCCDHAQVDPRGMARIEEVVKENQAEMSKVIRSKRKWNKAHFPSTPEGKEQYQRHLEKNREAVKREVKPQQMCH